MAGEHAFDDKGKVKPKPTQETEQAQKDNRPLTVSEMSGKLDANKLTRMQRTLGNAAVQRFLAQRMADGPAELDEETSETINARRGSGHKLDENVASKAGGVMGHDFSDVNVHTDGQSDQLNRQLQAKAFTLGNDIFFRSGEYSPGSDEGQRLISHELTHVVQQGAAVPSVQGKMTVNDPNDQYEAEADAVAEKVMSQRDDAVAQREGEEEEEAIPPVQLQEEEEPMRKPDSAVQLAAPEEEVDLKPDDAAVQRAAPEEEMALKRDEAAVQRAMPEEEEAMPPVQKQEEELPMPKLDPAAVRRQDDDELV